MENREQGEAVCLINSYYISIKRILTVIILSRNRVKNTIIGLWFK